MVSNISYNPIKFSDLFFKEISVHLFSTLINLEINWSKDCERNNFVFRPLLPN